MPRINDRSDGSFFAVAVCSALMLLVWRQKRTSLVKRRPTAIHEGSYFSVHAT